MSKRKKIAIAVVTVVLAIVIGLVVVLNMKKTLNGRYVSESGKYIIDFEKDGDCTWTQDKVVYRGTYEEYREGWLLCIKGSGWALDTNFVAVEDGDDLIITGGIVDGETFDKED